MAVLELQIRQIKTTVGRTFVRYTLCVGDWKQDGVGQTYLERQAEREFSEVQLELEGELDRAGVIERLTPALQAVATAEGYELCL